MAEVSTYAERTKVAVTKSEADIKKYIRKQGSKDVGIIEFDGLVISAFRLSGRNIRFSAAVPTNDQKKRSLYRGLFLTIKAKCESAKAGIEAFDEAFMSQIIIPGGSTIGEDVLPRIEQAYSENRNIPLLPMI